MKPETRTITINSGGLCVPLLVLFVVLKLTGNIDWSWVWVTSPLWLPLAILLGFIACVGVFMLAVGLLALLAAKWLD